MTAVYFDKYGRMRISWYCNDPKTRRSNRGVCGAKTRKGTPCQAPPVWNNLQDKPQNGRCKLHGGLSTGPKTQAGKDAIRTSNRKRNTDKSSNKQHD
ncbi:HGGxSTG domain-containing protein [Legionella sp.]|uniref:HGGxSTG domain-containing protein n=1 Tax=Legionella sp. TaxID=459 RepID=UPI003C9929B0